MAFSTNIRLLTPLVRSMITRGQRASLLGYSNSKAAFSVMSSNRFNYLPSLSTQCNHIRCVGSDSRQTYLRDNDDKPQSLSQVLENEIQEETVELNRSLSSDQFPGFSVETDDADVKLTKQVGDSTVVVRFTVSSSLSEWRSDAGTDKADSQNPDEDYKFSLMSMPEFQVQIVRDGKTLEVSCYFEEMDQEDDSGDAYPSDPLFNIDEIVMYDGEPRETEFAVNTEYFREELQEGLLHYLAEHGVDDEFAKNLVSFATNYEKKLYIGLMKRLKDFVSR